MSNTHFAGQEFPQGKPMPTNDLRERFDKQFLNEQPYDSSSIFHSRFHNAGKGAVMIAEMYAFIELEVTRARQEERKQTLNWLLKNRNTVTLVQIEEYLAISSLK